MTPKRVPRVAFVAHSPWIAGAERVLLNLLQNLPLGEIRPVTIFPSTNGPIKSVTKQTLPFPMFELPYGFTIPTYEDAQLLNRIQQETLAFTNLFRELELDAVVVNTTVLYSASAATVRARIPLVLHCHGVLLPRAFHGLNLSAWRALEVLQCCMADTVLAPSRWIGDHLKDVCKVSESRLRILSNGTNLPVIDGEDLETGNRDRPEFVMLCTLEPFKGVNVFIEAAASFLAARPSGARFTVYGEGSPQNRQELDSAIRQYNLQDHFFLRPKQEVHSIYRQCCGVVVAAEFESFSMVVIEAMSYAKPVIATCCGGPEEIVEDGKTGFLIPIGDPQALAERMLKLAESPDLRRELGLAGRRKAESLYDIKLIARQYLDLILSVVDGGCSSVDAERKQFLEALLSASPNFLWPNERDPGLKKTYRTPVPSTTGSALLSNDGICQALEGLRSRLREINLGLNQNLPSDGL